MLEPGWLALLADLHTVLASKDVTAGGSGVRSKGAAAE
jgi:hypothetical protein